MAALMEVTQADRDAAMRFIPRNSIAGQDPDGICAGKYDEAVAIQAFARHRLAHSEPRPVAEDWTGERAWPEHLEAIAAYWSEWEEGRAGRGAYTQEELAEDAGEFANGLADYLATHSPAPTEAGEVERLRTALVMIAEVQRDRFAFAAAHSDWCQRTARAALTSTQGGAEG